MKLTNATLVFIACGTPDTGCMASEDLYRTAPGAEVSIETGWEADIARIEALGVIELGDLSDAPGAAARLHDFADAAEAALEHPGAGTCTEAGGTHDLARLNDLDIVEVVGVFGVAKDDEGLIIADRADCAQVSALHDIAVEVFFALSPYEAL